MFTGNGSETHYTRDHIVQKRKKKRDSHRETGSLVKSDGTISINTCLRGKKQENKLVIQRFIGIYIKKNVSLLEKVSLNLIEQIAIF